MTFVEQHLLSAVVFLPLIGALISGEAVIFLVGCGWLAVGMGWSTALKVGALPFVPGEIIKMGLIVAAAGGFALARRKA